MSANKIVECVPNFSEGRNQKVINALAEVFEHANGVRLLCVDPGWSTNRTVYTLAGSPECVIEVMLNAAELAYKLIDMRNHHGEHKRLGALDVCPFVPVSNVTMDDCVQYAKQLAERFAQRLQVPIFLYGAAAQQDYRRQVPQIREGEYEGLGERLKQSKWLPDYGPAHFVPSWGATMVGARQFLIAYNVNLLCTKNQANHIAFNIREQGRANEQKPGRLQAVQAMGWILEEANLAQVTTNIVDHKRTPIHRVWEEVNNDAEKLHVPVFGSEIVGVVPLDAMLEVADYFIRKDQLLILGEQDKIRLAVHKLGLSYLEKFKPEERVIEYIMRCPNVGCKKAESKEDETASDVRSQQFLQAQMAGLKLGANTVQKFVQKVAEREAVPGGGSVSALVGTLGAALGVMVGRLSSGCVAYQENEMKMRQLLPPLYDCLERSLELIDQDSDAFSQLMAANRNAPPLGISKEEAVRAATKQCIEIPLTLARHLDSLWATLLELDQIKNPNTSSDLQVAAFAFQTAVYGACANAEINIGPILEQEYIEHVKTNVVKYRKNADQAVKQINSA